MSWVDAVIHFCGYAVCHTLPERSLMIGGVYLPVCARCTGLYLGIFTSYAYLIGRRRFKINALPPLGVSLALAAALLPLAVDGVTSYAGLRETNNVIRFITGTMGGAVLPVFALPLVSRELITAEGGGKLKVPPFRGVADYCGWVLCLVGVAVSLWFAPPPLYYVFAVATTVGEIAIFFNLAFAVWDMVLERTRYGRRVVLAPLAFLTAVGVLTLLFFFHKLSLRALLSLPATVPKP